MTKFSLTLKVEIITQSNASSFLNHVLKIVTYLYLFLSSSFANTVQNIYLLHTAHCEWQLFVLLLKKTQIMITSVMLSSGDIIWMNKTISVIQKESVKICSINNQRVKQLDTNWLNYFFYQKCVGCRAGQDSEIQSEQLWERLQLQKALLKTACDHLLSSGLK